MAKKITYKVETLELQVKGQNLEDLINEHVSKGWILDKVFSDAQLIVVIFRDK
jgi:hypothetical protein|tara:strand:+ start:365 stop:523 length:159 start_codon:yes stop_codon:yes gene_type:complete